MKRLLWVLATFLLSMPVHAIAINHQGAARKQLESMCEKELDADWKLEDFFGTIFVINLPQATERRARIEETLKAVGVKEFEFFSAVDGRKDVPKALWKKMDLNWARHDLSTEKGQKAFNSQRQAEAGCYLSHLGVIKTVKKRFEEAKREMAHLLLKGGSPEAIREVLQKVRKSSSVLIIEDDNGFGIVDKDTPSLTGVGLLFRKSMQELPHEWDMLYFMAKSMEPEEPFSTHLVKLTGAIFTNAYAIHSRFYDKVVNHLEQIYDPQFLSFKAPYDGFLGRLHRRNRCFAINPSIAFQRDGVSSIVGWVCSSNRQYQAAEK